jgi:hypothetical protein
MTAHPAVRVVDELKATLGTHYGFCERVLEDSGFVPGPCEVPGQAFTARVHAAIDAMRSEFGPTGDPDIARRVGLDPECTFGPPAEPETDAYWHAFAVWRTRDIWIFLAARHYAQQRGWAATTIIGVARPPKAK